MIGIIGPADSVALAIAVARDDGLEGSVIGRVYETLEGAPELARELDRVCQVLLFTGRIPYALGVRVGDLRAALQYVPHSGADLYAAIVHLLRERGCRLPRLSLDTIESAIAQEAFEDMDLEPPRHVLSLETGEVPAELRSAADISAFHRERHRSGDVDVCLTCVASVYHELQAEGVPVLRVRHTRSAMREALRQARLAERLTITEGSQPAVVLVQGSAASPERADDGGPYASQRRQLRTREAVLDLAERLQGRVADVDGGTVIVYTSRSIIENSLSLLMAGHDGPLSHHRVPPDARIGVGLGTSVAMAEENARLARTMSERDGALYVGFPDGEVLRIGGDRHATTYRLRETHPEALRVAQELGIGPLALTRLTRALQQIDASAVTAMDLARAYGVEPRSARRLITALQRAGIATREGRQGGAGAGRPQTVYRIDLERLVGGQG
ncbi:transcriptional regulator [soil metagenome]